MVGDKFEVIDCYGRRIYCRMGLWYGKLRQKHGINDADEPLIKRAINQPEGGYPRYDYDDPKHKRIYYRQDPKTGEYVKVVVRFYRDKDEMVVGEVVTVYFETSMNSREKPEEKNDQTF
jgi:hypothetical protein